MRKDSVKDMWRVKHIRNCGQYGKKFNKIKRKRDKASLAKEINVT
jgi:hypothetical protein